MEAPFKIQNEFHLDATKFGDLADLPLDEREDANLRHLSHVRFNAPTPRAMQSLDFRSSNDGIENNEGGASACVLELSVQAITFYSRSLFFQRFLIPPNGYTLRLVNREA